MLEININTYVTVEEANEYIKQCYPELDNLAVTWSVLSDHDKEAYLISSASDIDKLFIMGRKLDKNQSMAFPRRECYKERQVPYEVKEAQIENALGLLNEKLSARSDEQMIILNSLGAIKNLKYNKREMGEVGLGATLTGGDTHNRLLASDYAIKLLKPWIGG